MNYNEILRKVPLFSGISDDDLKRISEHTVVSDFDKGDVIINEEAHDRRLFIILKGSVDVIKNMGSKKATPVGSFGPLSYFGEMSLIDDAVRSASIVAREKTQVLSINHLDLRNEIRQYPDMGIELLRMLSQRIRLMEETLINTLGAFLPVCANCRKIKEEDGSWSSIEKYISDHSNTEFSHGICPSCVSILYPEIAPGLNSKTPGNKH